MCFALRSADEELPSFFSDVFLTSTSELLNSIVRIFSLKKFFLVVVFFTLHAIDGATASYCFAHVLLRVGLSGCSKRFKCQKCAFCHTDFHKTRSIELMKSIEHLLKTGEIKQNVILVRHFFRRKLSPSNHSL